MTTAIIAGSSLLHSPLFKTLKSRAIKTRFGIATISSRKGLLFIQRHGKDMDILPHEINHKANIGALKKLGARRIISICSTGSYKKKIAPGSIVIPHDFIDLHSQETFFKTPVAGLSEAFTLPGIDEDLRAQIIRAGIRRKIQVVKKGVYLQVRGPRLETKAEVQVYSRFADIVGMTMASEATLAKEAGIPYAAICSVDNYGRGIDGSDVDFTSLRHVKEISLRQIRILIDDLLGGLI